MRNRTFAVSLFAVALWCTTAVAGYVHAEQDPKPAQAVLTTDINSDDDMKKMLENMGYEPAKLSAGYAITLKQDTWTVPVQLILSPSKTKIGFNANMGTVEDPAAVTAAEWQGLVIAQQDIEPSMFIYYKDTKRLFIHRTMDNRGVTPAILRKELDNFFLAVKNSKDIRKFAK